jgi:hypothetical protein
LAAGWIFTEEEFFPQNDWFNHGRLRLSWGKSGNRDIPSAIGGVYAALMNLTQMRYFVVDRNTGALVPVNSFQIGRMANSHLRWETSTAWNLGLDFGILRNRITGSIEAYHQRTNDLLLSRALPNITGYASVMSNIGEVQNRGIEITINSRNVRTQNFSWTTDFALAHNQNRINSLHGLMENVYDAAGNITGQRESDDIPNRRFIGHSLDQIWDFQILGVWQEGEEMDAAATARGLRPGDFRIWSSGNPGYSNDDRRFLGVSSPVVRASMRNSFTFFDDWMFSFNLNSGFGHMRAYNRVFNNNALMIMTNQIKNPFWTPDNPTNQYARIGSLMPVPGQAVGSGNNAQVNGGMNNWKRADFVRLENVALSYSFPRRMLQNTPIEAANINLSARNLAVLSRFPGEDPEHGGNFFVTGTTPGQGGNVPRVVTIGANITF